MTESIEVTVEPKSDELVLANQILNMAKSKVDDYLLTCETRRKNKVEAKEYIRKVESDYRDFMVTVDDKRKDKFRVLETLPALNRVNPALAKQAMDEADKAILEAQENMIEHMGPELGSKYQLAIVTLRELESQSRNEEQELEELKSEIITFLDAPEMTREFMLDFMANALTPKLCAKPQAHSRKSQQAQIPQGKRKHGICEPHEQEKTGGNYGVIMYNGTPYHPEIRVSGTKYPELAEEMKKLGYVASEYGKTYQRIAVDFEGAIPEYMP